LADSNIRHPEVNEGPIKEVLNSSIDAPLFKIIFVRHGEKSPYYYIDSIDKYENYKIGELKRKYMQLNLTDFGKRTN